VPFNKFVLDSYLTLSQIQLEKISIISDKKDFDYGLKIRNDNLEIADSGNSSLVWKAELKAKWSFKVGFSTIQEGTFTAGLEAKNTTFSFKFFEDYSKSSANVTNDWKITKSEIKGYGAYKEIHEKLKSMVKEKLSLKINEELTKHGDLLLYLMTYSRSFRKMSVTSHTEIGKTLYSYVLMNEINKLGEPEANNPLKIMFGGYMLNEQTHTKRPLNYSSMSSNPTDVDIVLSFNQNTLKEVFNAFLADSFETLFFNKTELEKLLGDSFNIKTLARFYPRIAGAYDPEEKLELGCTLLNKNNEYTCAFFLAGNKPDMVLLIDKLEWGQNFNFSYLNDTRQSITIENKPGNFKSIAIESVKIDQLSAIQLMLFLKPLSDHLTKISVIKLNTVSKSDDLVYHGSVPGEQYLDLKYNITA